MSTFENLIHLITSLPNDKIYLLIIFGILIVAWKALGTLNSIAKKDKS